jgi:hypothetical protein
MLIHLAGSEFDTLSSRASMIKLNKNRVIELGLILPKTISKSMIILHLKRRLT